MNRIKVLMVGNDPSVKGGITSVISQILSHDWNADNVKMKFIPTYIEANRFKQVVFFFNAYLQTAKEIRQNKPSVLHMHMSYKGSFVRKYMLYKLARKNNVPVMVHLHGSEFKKWYDTCSNSVKNKIKDLLSGSACFIVLGEKWNTIIKEIEPSANTGIIENTVHIPEKKAVWQDNLSFLFLGVLIKRKGVYDLLNAIKKVKAEIGDAEFIIAGTGSEMEKLKKQAEQLQIEDIVKFIGWVDGAKKKQLLEECQVMVLPSYNEGLPIAVLEAISYGMPVISTFVGDIPSAVHHGKNGFLISPGNTEALAENIKTLAQNPSLYASMSRSSR